MVVGGERRCNHDDGTHRNATATQEAAAQRAPIRSAGCWTSITAGSLLLKQSKESYFFAENDAHAVAVKNATLSALLLCLWESCGLIPRREWAGGRLGPRPGAAPPFHVALPVCPLTHATAPCNMDVHRGERDCRSLTVVGCPWHIPTTEEGGMYTRQIVYLGQR